MAIPTIPKTLPLPLYEKSQSMVSTFQKCEMRYLFRYLLRLSRVKAIYPLIVGTWVHTGLEELLKKDKRDGSTKLVKALQLINSAATELNATADPALGIDIDKLEYSRAQALAVVKAWHVVHGDQDWYFLGSEINVRAAEAPLAVPEDMNFWACGKIDAIIMDDEGCIWLVEHKTRATLSNQDFVSALSIDHQSLWYMVIGNMLLQQSTVKKKIWDRLQVIIKAKTKKKMPEDFAPQLSGVMFDAIQKPQHKNAQSFEQLSDRMADAMIAEPEKYFFLEPIFIDQRTVVRAKQNFERAALKMDSLTLDNVTQTFSACHVVGQGPCPYQIICKSGIDVRDLNALSQLDQLALYEERSPYTELEEDGEE